MHVVTSSRRPHLRSVWLIAAALFAACAPVVVPSAARPDAASPSPAASDDQAPGGDSVTGGGSAPGTTTAPEVAPRSQPEVEPDPTVAPRASAAAPAEPFAMNLYRKGDFVAQYTFEWCVGASLQMAINMATDESRTSRADQQSLWEMARDRSFSPFGGANPVGWTAVLNEVGVGPYQLVSIPTLDEALSLAAEALRETKRPVGLVMWRGRHAWVMSGFESSADPRTSDDFDVTGIRVLDPLYPHGSSVWGKSPKPNSLVSPATLGKQFVARDVTRSRVNLGVPTGYLMILPVAVG